MKFYIGYLRNENIFILLNACYDMGLFIKIIEARCKQVGIEIPKNDVLWQ